MKVKTPSLQTIAGVQRWLLTEPTLREMKAHFPDEWHQCRIQMLRASERGEIRALIAELGTRRSSLRDHQASEQQRISDLVRTQLILRTLRSVGLSAEAGVAEGTIRLPKMSGWLMQKLFFSAGLVRKPVSMRKYRMIWPLLRGRERLMPLVRAEGIYCFYSKEFIAEVTKLAAGRPVLEIAAGDGTLTRFLRDAGVDCIATDDHSWSREITYGSSVEKLDARQALRKYKPEVVICSWPPPGNSFERDVFSTGSVRVYIAVVSSARAEAGNWDTYARQTGQRVQVSSRLGRQVLPDRSNQVLVFDRLD
ncbi:MAG: hypothetical protein BGO97_10630 [Micrococcales bacterium 70-64]|nr:hypothetical protein [Leifsonia sp.]ODU64439.1 MAG: hypothetical protein ABT06_10635 [Leifsonia sp. SCN 70-46]OJX86130.1 MAG: hypothetical protein BGO97_10630 [Micrococcales bacterium 70-64]